MQALREHQAAEVRRAESAAVEEALQRRTLEQQRAAREVQRLQVHIWLPTRSLNAPMFCSLLCKGGNQLADSRRAPGC